jgi:hypothetical protein
MKAVMQKINLTHFKLNTYSYDRKGQHLDCDRYPWLIMTASFANIKDRVREAGTRIDITIWWRKYDCKDEDDDRKVRVPR